MCNTPCFLGVGITSLQLNIMNLSLSTSTTVRQFLAFLAIFALLLTTTQGLFPGVAGAVKPVTTTGAANIDQAENGKDAVANVVSPVDWVNGNVNEQKGHYVEGQSIPYRMILTDLTPGTSNTLIIGFDVIKANGQDKKFAIDYITSNNRIDETVDPCSGTASSICSGTESDAIEIPAPNYTGSLNGVGASDVTDSFDALVVDEGAQYVKMWNGSLDSIAYTVSPDLSSSNYEAQVSIVFTPTSDSAVISWGGHISSSVDYPGESAITIPGSPYHSRLISLNGGGGNQDLALSASAVALPGNVTITKVVTNDNGGSLAVADFPLFVGTTEVTSGVPTDIDAGTYFVSETGDANYTASTWSGDCDPDTGELVVEEGQTYACSITNDDIAPSLTLTKIISGGTATATDFEVKATGTGNEGSIAGDGYVASGATFKAGIYTLSETDNYVGDGEYVAGDWQCTGATVTNGNEITIGLGDDVACSITNTYVPPKSATLHVVKNLVQNSGGTEDVSDFSFTFNGQTYTWDFGVDTKTIYVAEADFGTYSVAEDENSPVVVGRYDVTYDNCTNLDLSFDGAEETCTITNDDNGAGLHVIKQVVNDDGAKDNVGSDFTIQVDGTNVRLLGGDWSDSVTFQAKDDGGEVFVAFDANSPYSVDELDSLGYVKTLGDGCSGTLDLGEQATCIITNDDPAPTSAYITLVKTVLNDDGRTLGVADFPLYINGVQATSGEAVEVFSEGDYTMTEDGDEWYTAGDWGGDCAADGTLSGVTFGNQYTCTITNDDIPGSSITIDKVVTGEQASESQSFSFSLTGDATEDFSLAGETTPKAFNDLMSGTYTITEGAVPDRWNLDGDVAISCDGAASSTVDINEASSSVAITLVAGENISCTFTNEYTPQDSSNSDENIVVIKEVTDGSDTDTQFDFVITQMTGSRSGATTSFALSDGMSYDTGDIAAGEYYSINESIMQYWSLASTSCVTSRDGQDRVIDPSYFEVRERETITCTFVNDQQLFELFGTVWHDVNKDGVFDETESALAGWAVAATNGSKTYNTSSASDGSYSFMVPAGTWTISETVQSGWSQTFPSVGGTHVVEIPQIAEIPPVQEEFTFLDSVIDFFTPSVAYASVAPYILSYGSFDFGNVQEGGSNGGSKSPSCQAFDATRSGNDITLRWETSRANEISITANGVVIFTSDDDATVDAGGYAYADGGDVDFVLTAIRGNRTRTCTASVTDNDGGTGPTPQVLGEQVSAVPLGAADAGKGGTAPRGAELPVFLAVLRRNRNEI